MMPSNQGCCSVGTSAAYPQSSSIKSSAFISNRLTYWITNVHLYSLSACTIVTTLLLRGQKPRIPFSSQAQAAPTTALGNDRKFFPRVIQKIREACAVPVLARFSQDFHFPCLPLNRDAASAMGASCRASLSSARDYCFTSMAKKKHFARGGISEELSIFARLLFMLSSVEPFRSCFDGTSARRAVENSRRTRLQRPVGFC